MAWFRRRQRTRSECGNEESDQFEANGEVNKTSDQRVIKIIKSYKTQSVVLFYIEQMNI